MQTNEQIIKKLKKNTNLQLITRKRTKNNKIFDNKF